MNATIRAKIKIDWVKESRNTASTPGGTEGAKVGEQISAGAVYSEDKTSENYSFSVATPSLNLGMYISNPSAFDKLITGKEYYLDFIPVEEEDESYADKHIGQLVP